MQDVKGTTANPLGLASQGLHWEVAGVMLWRRRAVESAAR